ncbi:MAG: radical SAM protein [Deltaproteobacteria bacterium]|nr:MAG: radical SAM protein [Deltaproteobacteria bacterium]
MQDIRFEIGPIRPPSEAYSLLLRITRNCPWNKCLFCHIYKGRRFERRSVKEVKEDIDNAYRIAQQLRELSWRLGAGGEISREVLHYVFGHPYNECFRMIALWLHLGGRTVFLQDANSLVLKAQDLAEILTHLKERFPQVERITSYARSRTIARTKTVEDLKLLREAGLTRLHLGLETGWDPLLDYMRKGVTASQHIEAGRKIMEAGIELSEYVMPGLGGRRWWREHALKTAEVLNQISPHFIRLRTLMVLPQMPLWERIREGEFELESEEEVVREIRLFVESLEAESYLVSDHILNLLGELEGKIPEEKPKLLGIIDRFLSLSPDEKLNFCLGRRAGVYERLDDMEDLVRFNQVEELKRKLEREYPGGVEGAIFRMKEAFL